MSSLNGESETVVKVYAMKVNPLVDESPNVVLAVLLIARTRKLVGVPDQVYIQRGH